MDEAIGWISTILREDYYVVINDFIQGISKLNLYFKLELSTEIPDNICTIPSRSRDIDIYSNLSNPTP